MDISSMTTGELRNLRDQAAKMLEYRFRAEQDQVPGARPMAGTESAQQESPGRTFGLRQARSIEQAIDDLFTYHDNPDAAPHYVEVREAAKVFAKVVCRHAPIGTDRVTSVGHIRSAVMFANAAIALGGRGL